MHIILQKWLARGEKAKKRGNQNLVSFETSAAIFPNRKTPHNFLEPTTLFLERVAVPMK